MGRDVFRRAVLVVWIEICALSCASAGVAATTSDLSLRDCIERAIHHNFSIEASRLGQEIAEWAVRREWAAFEPEFTGSARRERDERENTVEQSRSQISPFFEEENQVYDAAIRGLFFSGASYRLGYALSDLANNLTNVTFQNEFESQYPSFAGASITQPLLKGAGWATTLAAVRLAGVQSEIALQDLRRQMMNVVAQTETAYWDLVLAQTMYQLRGESARVARKILEDSEERVRTGKMPELELAHAKSGVAEREIRKQEARRQVIEATSRLYTLFSERADHGTESIRAVDQIRVEELDWDFDQGMQVATQLQPDYQRSRHQLAQEDVRLGFAKRERWPQIDLIASYGLNGLGDSASSSWDDIKDGEFESWSVGVQLAIGLGGGQRTRSEWKAANLRKRQALLGMKQVEIEMSNALDAGIRQLDILRKSIANYAIVVRFNQRLLDVELERLETGKSNTRNVLEYEEELFEAKSAHSLSQNSYQKTLVQLHLVMGKTLDVWDVEILHVAREAIIPTETMADEAISLESGRLEQPVPRGQPLRLPVERTASGNQIRQPVTGASDDLHLPIRRR